MAQRLNWVTQSTHLGSHRNYVEMDIDDAFTPDNTRSIARRHNDYSDADSQRMTDETLLHRLSGPTPSRTKLGLLRSP